MSFIRRLFGPKKPRLPFRTEGSGKTKDDPLKIIPSDLDTMLQDMAKVLKADKPELFIGNDGQNREIVAGVASGMCKSLYLEHKLGKEGVAFKLGGRMHLKNGIIAQEIVCKGRGNLIFFDTSAFLAPPKEEPNSDYILPETFINHPRCKDLTDGERIAVLEQLKYFGDQQIHASVAEEIFASFAAIGLCHLASNEVILEKLDSAFSSLSAAKKVYNNEALNKEFDEAIGNIAIGLLTRKQGEDVKINLDLFEKLKHSIENALRVKYKLT